MQFNPPHGCLSLFRELFEESGDLAIRSVLSQPNDH